MNKVILNLVKKPPQSISVKIIQDPLTMYTERSIWFLLNIYWVTQIFKKMENIYILRCLIVVVVLELLSLPEIIL